MVKTVAIPITKSIISIPLPKEIPKIIAKDMTPITDWKRIILNLPLLFPLPLLGDGDTEAGTGWF